MKNYCKHRIGDMCAHQRKKKSKCDMFAEIVEKKESRGAMSIGTYVTCESTVTNGLVTNINII